MLNPFDAEAVAHAARAQRPARRRGDRHDDGPAAGRSRPSAPALRSAPTAASISRTASSRVADTLGTSRTLALAIREGRRCRPRPLRPQDDRLRDLAGPAGGRRVPRLAAPDERRLELELSDGTTPCNTRDGRRLRDIRARPAGASSPSRHGADEATGAERRPDRRLDGGRSRRRRAAGRQALRPDGLADARPRSPRRHARARGRAVRRRCGGGARA